MPKDNRFGDTVAFIRSLDSARPRVPSALAVGELLETFTGALPPAVNIAMSMGRSGTEQTRKYRRAMILILCVLGNAAVADAVQAVNAISDNNLASSLTQMCRDVATVYGRRTFTPAVDKLLEDPLTFLTNNRVKTGRSNLTVSGTAEYAVSWDIRNKYWNIEPTSGKEYVHTTVSGYNIAVSQYRDIKDEQHDIPGSIVTGDLGLTTQLSSCTVIYKVAGANLTVAHINPERAYTNRFLPQDLANMENDPPGVVQTYRLARDGNLAGGGTLGIFGMLKDGANTGLQYLGARRVRTHGYTAALGNAYFIGVKVAGSWQLFGQQNNPGRGDAGVSNIMQLWP